MTTTRLFSTALIVAAVATTAPATAQQVAPTTLPAGSEIRLTLVGSKTPLHAVGGRNLTLLAADSAFVWVSGLTRGSSDSIAYLALRRMEVRAGTFPRSRAVTAGALGTVGVEGLFFVVAGLTTPREIRDAAYYRSMAKWLGGGAIIGGAIGAIVSTERWKVLHPPLRVSPPDAYGPR